MVLQRSQFFFGGFGIDSHGSSCFGVKRSSCLPILRHLNNPKRIWDPSEKLHIGYVFQAIWVMTFIDLFYANRKVLISFSNDIIESSNTDLPDTPQPEIRSKKNIALRGFGNLEHRSLTEQTKFTSQEKGVKFQQNEVHLWALGGVPDAKTSPKLNLDAMSVCTP